MKPSRSWRNGLALGLMFVSLYLFAIVAGNALWFGREAQQVSREEFGPREALRKYEWFKDAAAALDRKLADASLLESQIEAAREDGDETGLRLYRSEHFGVLASYNRLAAEYNAQMAKFNWRFAEAGRLPEGATEPLPREYKPYVRGELPQ